MSTVRVGPTEEERKVTSVGLVCSCGQAVAGIPGSTCTCRKCGAIWLVSVMQVMAERSDGAGT